MYYGGWAHPWTVRKFFKEEITGNSGYKLHKSCGRYELEENFFGDSGLIKIQKLLEQTIRFEMPYSDFKTLFVRNDNSNIDITNNDDVIYDNPPQKIGNTMSGDWDLFDLLSEDEYTYSKNDRNKGYKKIR